MYGLKKMTQKISKTYTLSFPKAAHSLEAQDQGDQGAILRVIGHKPLEWEGSVSSLISHNAIDFGFFLALFRFIPFLLYFLRRLSTSPAV